MKPSHIAIILDGNGRWAEKRGLPRAMGHKAGCENLERILRSSSKLGIKYLTVYAFSTENWKRSEEEVKALMNLFRIYLERFLKEAMENNLCVRMIGERTRLSKDIQDGILRLEEETKNNTGLTFTFAMNYGSRDEIIRACRKIIDVSKKESIELTEDVFESFLDTEFLPDPDLVIRTSGEFRISNFLLWQSAYSEYYITDVLWPDFNEEELLKAVNAYGKRNRRFGGRNTNDENK